MNHSVRLAASLGNKAFYYLREKNNRERIIDFVKGEETITVILLGASGVGKTSLLKALKNELASTRIIERTLTIDTVKGKIKNINFEIIDTPGQAGFDLIRSEAIDIAKRSEYLGILHVVCYGYHQTTANSKNQAVLNDLPNPAYLDEKRNTELSEFRKWVGVGGQSSLIANAQWLITLINKADIWWSDTNNGQIINYYQEGKYKKTLSSIIAKSIPVNQVLPFCATNDGFYNCRMSGYYTDTIKSCHFDALIQNILNLSS